MGMGYVQIFVLCNRGVTPCRVWSNRYRVDITPYPDMLVTERNITFGSSTVLTRTHQAAPGPKLALGNTG